ncbi:hypothetical protein L211DRAFT_853673 [Terfezia boudieri ATCC MYA-4762]|uniref:C2H2-type domain-containing protein n=1 Tax=Terfezia boudieri ATCC MYA-4762 TaxID=1051890 RepID=A0A3N4LBQ8_9PEZI|nr:hypothetical protein L211DRAFT_853673 [Terfezia boudieri ATCC MYA-4762]
MPSTPPPNSPPHFDPFLALYEPWNDHGLHVEDAPALNDPHDARVQIELAEPQIPIDPVLPNISTNEIYSEGQLPTPYDPWDDDIWNFISDETMHYASMEPDVHYRNITTDPDATLTVEQEEQVLVQATAPTCEDHFPNFSDVTVSDTEVTPDEIFRIIHSGSPLIESARTYSASNPDQPDQDPAVAQNTKYLLGNLDPGPQIIDSTPINPVAHEPSGPIQPQLTPPQDAQASPRTGKRFRAHRRSTRSACVGQEEVHGNAGKKRQRKDKLKPTMNVYKCDQCGELYDEIGKMTNHVKHRTGHNYEEVTISWVGDGTVQPAKGFISGETYLERVRRQQAEKEAKRDEQLTNKRKRAEPESQRAGQTPNPSKKRRRAAAKTPEAPEEPAPTRKKRAPRKSKLEPKPKSTKGVTRDCTKDPNTITVGLQDA